MQSKPLGFPRHERLRKEEDFKLVYTGKRLSGKLFILYYKKIANITIGRKVGITVSKKVSKLAVNRNKIKRRIKEVYRYNKYILPEEIWLVVRSLPNVAQANYDEIRKEIIKLFKMVASKESGNSTNKSL